MDNIEQRSTLKTFLTSHVTAIDIVAAILIILLVMSNTFFVLRYSQLRSEVNENVENIGASKLNRQVLDFSTLFIEKVLKAESEIDFETRLKLEGSVRALNDEEILAAWQTFTDSTTETQAQNAVKILLGILISRIQ